MLSQIQPGKVIWTIQGNEPRFVRGKFFELNTQPNEEYDFDLEKDVLHTGTFDVPPCTTMVFTWERYDKDSEGNVTVFDSNTETITTLPTWTYEFLFYQQEGVLYAIIESTEETNLIDLTIDGQKKTTSEYPTSKRHVIEIPVCYAGQTNRIYFALENANCEFQILWGQAEVFAAPSYDSFYLQPYHQVFFEALQHDKEKLVCNILDLLLNTNISNIEPMAEDLSMEQRIYLRDLFTRYTIRFGSNNEELVRRFILWFKYENYADYSFKLFTPLQKVALLKMLMSVASEILYNFYCEKISDALQCMNNMHLIHYKQEHLNAYQNAYEFFVNAPFELDTEWNFMQAVNRDIPL